MTIRQAIFEQRNKYIQTLRKIKHSNSVLMRLDACLCFLEQAAVSNVSAVGVSYLEEILTLMVPLARRSLAFGVLPSLPQRIRLALDALPRYVRIKRSSEIESLRQMIELYLLVTALLAGSRRDAEDELSRITGSRRLAQPAEDGIEFGSCQYVENIVFPAFRPSLKETAFADGLLSRWKEFERPFGLLPLAMFLERSIAHRTIYPWCYLDRPNVHSERPSGKGNPLGRSLIINLDGVRSDFARQCSVALHVATETLMRHFGLRQDQMPDLFRLTLSPGPFEYTGASAGLCVALAAISTAGSVESRCPEISFAQDAAFIGALGPKGEVEPVSDEGVRMKCRVAMASPLKKLVIPEKNLEACEEEIEDSRRAGRKIDLFPVSSIREVISNPVLTSIKRPSYSLAATELKTSYEIQRKSSLLMLLFVFLLTLNAVLPVRAVINTIALDKDEVVATDPTGQEIWRIPLGSIDSEPGSWLLDCQLPADLGGDQRSEWVLALRKAEPGGDTYQTHIACFGPDRGLIWSSAVGKDLDFGGVKVASDYVVSSLLHFDRKDEPLITVVAVHRTSFPTLVESLDIRGNVKGSYVHVGHVGSTQKQVAVYDLDGDGERELLLGGNNPTHNRGVLVVLKPSNLWGTSPFKRNFNVYLLPDQRGCQPWYLLFPQSDITRVSESGNEVCSLGLKSNTIMVDVVEDPDKDARVLFELDRDLREISRRGNASYQRLYDHFVRLARIVPMREGEGEGPSPILYWDGEDWTSLPSDNSLGQPIRRVKRMADGSLVCEVDVPVNARRFDSGIVVPAGSFLSISAGGRARAINEDNPAILPIGFGAWRDYTGEPMGSSDYPVSSLCGRIGESGEPFYIGLSHSGEVQRGGKLFFFLNKGRGELPVNISGFWRANITIDPPGVPRIEYFRVNLDRESGQLVLEWDTRNAVRLRLNSHSSLDLVGSIPLTEINSKTAKVILEAENEVGVAYRELYLPTGIDPPEIVEAKTIEQGISYRVRGTLFVEIEGVDEYLPSKSGLVYVESGDKIDYRIKAMNRYGASTKIIRTKAHPSGTAILRIPANQIWFNTGIPLTRRERIKILAEGNVFCGGYRRSVFRFRRSGLA